MLKTKFTKSAPAPSWLGDEKKGWLKSTKKTKSPAKMYTKFRKNSFKQSETYMRQLGEFVETLKAKYGWSK